MPIHAIILALTSLIPVILSVTVTTKQGQILGKTVVFNDKKVHQYLGIPYAESPDGELRFRKPAPLQNFPTVFIAYNNPAACWQISEYPFPWYDSDSAKNENCLFLNIWTPSGASVDNPKAVVYWIHGGGFRYGSNAQKVYQGVPLAALGDVVVVTVNYRLGPFGFLVSGTEDAPGNVGLWDILSGLQWVNDNIHYFGGDASRITIAGEGSGSTAVGLLSVSPLAKGLFHRQIMESGSPVDLRFDDNERNSNLSQTVAQRAGCANETFTLKDNPREVLKCLRRVSAEGLSAVHANIRPQFTTTFLPQYGDELLPSNPRKAVLDDDFSCKDVLIGINKDEGSYILTTGNPKLFGFFGQKDPAISKTTAKGLLQSFFANFSDPSAVTQHYLPSTQTTDEDLRPPVYAALGDETTVCPAEFYAERCAEGSGGKVFGYLWDHRPGTSPWAPWMGVAHFDEVQFVFGSPIVEQELYEEGEEELSREVMQMWADFAKDGNPSSSWQPYTTDNPQVKFIGPEPNTEKYDTFPQHSNCEFFKPYFGF